MCNLKPLFDKNCLLLTNINIKKWSIIEPKTAHEGILVRVEIYDIRGHSITTWTRRGGEGVNQMSRIVHAREGGGLGNVHVDKILGKMYNFCP